MTPRPLSPISILSPALLDDVAAAALELTAIAPEAALALALLTAAEPEAETLLIAAEPEAETDEELAAAAELAEEDTTELLA